MDPVEEEEAEVMTRSYGETHGAGLCARRGTVASAETETSRKSRRARREAEGSVQVPGRPDRRQTEMETLTTLGKVAKWR